MNVTGYGRKKATFLLRSDALHSHEDLPILDFMTPFDVFLERNESVQLLAIPISKRRLAQYALIAILLHHKVAAIISLWKDGRD